MPENFQVKLESPTAQNFIMLREKIGWQNMSVSDVEMSLNNSLFHVAIYSDSQLVGMGRVIGDGVMYFYIQDVVVEPIHQGFGVGAVIMENVEKYLASVTKKGATIGLLAAKGKEDFYARYGYIERPNHSLGNGMCKFV